MFINWSNPWHNLRKFEEELEEEQSAKAKAQPKEICDECDEKGEWVWMALKCPTCGKILVGGT